MNNYNKGGRPPISDPAKNCVKVRFTDKEYARFLKMYEESGVYAKSVFIKARVFNEVFKVLKTDRSALEYTAKLTTFYAQFRAIGVNYNQIVKILHTNFSEKKALALLYKLEKETIKMVEINRKIIALSEEFQQQYLNKISP